MDAPSLQYSPDPEFQKLTTDLLEQAQYAYDYYIYFMYNYLRKKKPHALEASLKNASHIHAAKCADKVLRGLISKDVAVKKAFAKQLYWYGNIHGSHNNYTESEATVAQQKHGNNIYLHNAYLKRNWVYNDDRTFCYENTQFTSLIPICFADNLFLFDYCVLKPDEKFDRGGYLVETAADYNISERRLEPALKFTFHMPRNKMANFERLEEVVDVKESCDHQGKISNAKVYYCPQKFGEPCPSVITCDNSQTENFDDTRREFLTDQEILRKPSEYAMGQLNDYLMEKDNQQSIAALDMQFENCGEDPLNNKSYKWSFKNKKHLFEENKYGFKATNQPKQTKLPDEENDLNNNSFSKAWFNNPPKKNVRLASETSVKGIRPTMSESRSPGLTGPKPYYSPYKSATMINNKSLTINDSFKPMQLPAPSLSLLTDDVLDESCISQFPPVLTFNHLEQIKKSVTAKIKEDIKVSEEAPSTVMKTPKSRYQIQRPESLNLMSTPRNQKQSPDTLPTKCCPSCRRVTNRQMPGVPETPFNARKGDKKTSQTNYRKHDEDSGYNVADCHYEMEAFKKQNTANYVSARKNEERKSRTVQKMITPLQKSRSKTRNEHEEHKPTFFEQIKRLLTPKHKPQLALSENNTPKSKRKRSSTRDRMPSPIHPISNPAAVCTQCRSTLASKIDQAYKTPNQNETPKRLLTSKTIDQRTNHRLF
uniref:SCP domain-containing protein n=1 Tax=Rhabditophanes sp. KR3021 TaxID=114890 RepID=A0AC35TYM0_9BILA